MAASFPLVPRDLLPLGTQAPDFQGPDQSGAVVRGSDFRGRWLVLYFYPKDRTRNCTKEACGFRDQAQPLADARAAVVGVSRDTVASHADFARRRGLSFPLVSDPGGGIARAYRARGWLGFPRRVTYVIDPDGRIARRYESVHADRHAAEVLTDLRRLKEEKGAIVPHRTGSAP